jgi:hypothetical protein
MKGREGVQGICIISTCLDSKRKKYILRKLIEVSRSSSRDATSYSSVEA